MSLFVLCSSIVAAFIVCSNGQSNYTFAFGNTEGDNMVLQQAPYRAKIWGTSPKQGDSIKIQLQLQSTSQLIETMTVTTGSNYVWSAYLNPRTASFDEYTILATMVSTQKSVTIQHILFGDVYICSGQSNMQFTVDQAFNATAEVAAADNYPYIRLYTAAEIGSPTPQLEILSIEEHWSVASSAQVGHGNWSYMSAMCWFFGRNMFAYLNYPIGLIGTNYGGTPVRYWSSPEALAQCNESISVKSNSNDLDVLSDEHKLTNDDKYYFNAINEDSKAPELADSQLWNAMIYPFLQTTIRAAIWYQGEADSNPTYAAPYACQFPSMIADWRLKWSLNSGTSADFPFGFVQLSTWNDAVGNKTCGDTGISCTAVAVVRYAQTGNYGYVPNKMMPNTFMATAIDLGDPTSPFGDVHPRYKQEVAERLTVAGKNVIYGESELYFGGPIAESAEVSGGNILVNFRNVGDKGLTIKNSDGFELFDKSKSSWVTVTGTLASNGDFNVNVPVPTGIAITDVSMVRYNWYQAPCNNDKGIHNCAIYDTQYQLPATPFMLEF